MISVEKAKKPAPAKKRPSCRRDRCEKKVDGDSDAGEADAGAGEADAVERGKGLDIVPCWRNAIEVVGCRS